MLKYIIEYTNVVGARFKAEISDVNFDSEPTYIRGTAKLEYAKVNRALESIRGSALTLDLESDENIDITDLYTENETDISVDFYQNDLILFKGFVKPDGIYTDFVNEKYIISLDCVDGLGTLKNLSFVDEGGIHFVGFKKELFIIYNCLRRTSINLAINTDIGIFHNAISEVEEDTLDVLDNTKLSADRFYKDDQKEDIMDCEEVLKSVLDKYCAVIHQHNGEWVIYRPQDLAKNKTTNFYRYIDGDFSTRTPVTNHLFNLGSYIDAYYPHHANKNQRININGSVSAFRVNYKYGISKGFWQNPALLALGDGTIEGWISNPAHKYTLLDPATGGIRWDGNDLTFSAFEMVSEPIVVNEGDTLKLALSYFSTGFHSDLSLYLEVSDGTQGYFYNGTNWVLNDGLSSSATWEIQNSDYDYKVCVSNIGLNPTYEYDLWKIGNGDLVVDIKIEPLPIQGNLLLYVRKPRIHTTPLTCNVIPESYSFIKRIELIGSLDGLKKGEFHTVERVPKSSSIVENNVTIFNGDMISDIYEGTIKALDNTNTYEWRHKNMLGIEPEKKILQIMAEDTLTSRIKPQKVFVGDVFGVMPFLSVFAINNVQGDFLPLSYRYDTKQNIVSLELVEVFYDTQGATIEYEETFEYNNVVKPTIR